MSEFGGILGSCTSMHTLGTEERSFKVSTETRTCTQRNPYRPHKYLYMNMELKCHKQSFSELEINKYKGFMMADVFLSKRRTH